MAHYRALLVANSKFYADPERLPELKAPIYDMARLQDALIHPEFGLFDRERVQLLPNARCSDVLLTMEDFFQSAEPEDTMLLYYSGHGNLDINNNFFLCASDTRMDRLMSTAMRDEQVNAMMRASPARTFVLILDCCSSGAWKSPAELLPDALRGSGRFLLTSSRAGQNSGDAGVETESSAFTKLLVQAMEEADLDTDQDGYVDIDEIYKHVERNLRVTGQQAQRDFGKSVRSVALARRARSPTVTEPIPVQPVGPHEPPSLTVTPERLQLTARADELPLVERIYVFNRGGGTITWSADTDDAWISLEPHEEFVRVSLSPPAAGSHRGSVYIREQGGAVKRVRVTVQLEEAEAAGAADRGPDRIDRHRETVGVIRGRRKALVGSVAALLALIVVVTIAVVTGGPDGTGDGGGIPSQGTEKHVQGQTILAWSPVGVELGDGASRIRGITAAVEQIDGVTVAAAGSVGPDGASDAAIWLDRDGRWELHALREEGDQAINGIVGSGSRFIAVGTSSTGGEVDAAVWTVSADGSFERVTDPDFARPGVQTLEKAIPSGQTGVLAVGRDQGDGAVWSLGPGDDWTRVAGGAEGLGGDGEQVLLRIQKFTPAGGGAEKLIAVGYELNGTDRDGAVWIADEPGSWTRVSLPEELFGGAGDQVLTDVTKGIDGGVVAAGYTTDGADGLDAAVWLSKDAKEWTRPSSTGVFGGAGDQVIARVISPKDSDPYSLVAGGYDEWRGNRDAVLWYSDDGRTWRKEKSIDLGGSGRQEIFALHRQSSSILAVGYDDGTGEANAAIWKGSG